MKKFASKSVTQFQRDIGTALKSLRIQAGFRTSKSFARKHGLPEIQYWRLENGRANVTLKSIARILSIHKMDIAEFFKKLEEYKLIAGTTILESGLIMSDLATDDLVLQHVI